jgi:hypothetical protein
VPLEEEEETSFDPELTEESWESFEREFDARGNWIKDTKFEKRAEGGELVPIMVTYRIINYL